VPPVKAACLIVSPVDNVPEPPIEQEAVDGLNCKVVDDTFIGKLPDVPVTHVGYIVAFVDVSLVIAAFVEFVADVALPTNVVEVTDVNPVIVAGRLNVIAPVAPDVVI